MDIETWYSHQCLDFLRVRDLMDALRGRALALHRLPAAARASFIFTFLRAFLCSSTRAPEARTWQRLRLCVRSSLWKEPQLPGRERRAREPQRRNPGAGGWKLLR